MFFPDIVDMFKMSADQRRRLKELAAFMSDEEKRQRTPPRFADDYDRKRPANAAASTGVCSTARVCAAALGDAVAPCWPGLLADARWWLWDWLVTSSHWILSPNAFDYVCSITTRRRPLTIVMSWTGIVVLYRRRTARGRAVLPSPRGSHYNPYE